jgi:hypothetical protein
VRWLAFVAATLVALGLSGCGKRDASRAQADVAAQWSAVVQSCSDRAAAIDDALSRLGPKDRDALAQPIRDWDASKLELKKVASSLGSAWGGGAVPSNEWAWQSARVLAQHARAVDALSEKLAGVASRGGVAEGSGDVEAIGLILASLPSRSEEARVARANLNVSTRVLNQMVSIFPTNIWMRLDGLGGGLVVLDVDEHREEPLPATGLYDDVLASKPR